MKYILTKKRKIIIYKNVLAELEDNVNFNNIFMCNIINNKMRVITHSSYNIQDNFIKWKEFYKHMPKIVKYNNTSFKITITNADPNTSNVWFINNRAGNLKRIKVIKAIIKELETN